jgi:neurofibromin 1
MTTIRKHIWAEVAKLDSNIVDIVLDELVRTATDGGIGTRRCETISHIVAALSSISVRGRIYSKLRKVRHMGSILGAFISLSILGIKQSFL